MNDNEWRVPKTDTGWQQRISSFIFSLSVLLKLLKHVKLIVFENKTNVK